MSEAVKSEEKNEEELRKFVYNNYYKMRKCNIYEMEYKECSSIKGRFQQYYVYGETLDCSQWKEDFKNCNKYQESKNIDLKAVVSIIQHENERFEKRMKAHLANDVWEKRSEPPPDWNSKLPEWLEKRENNSFPNKPNIEGQLCVIF